MMVIMNGLMMMNGALHLSRKRPRELKERVKFKLSIDRLFLINQ